VQIAGPFLGPGRIERRRDQAAVGPGVEDERLPAFSDDVGRSWIERHTPLVSLTAATLADPRDLANELQDIRRAGLAYDREESTSGLVCVDAPLLTADGTARAAMSVSMPAGGRITPAQVAPAVRTSGRALSRELHRLGLASSR
jgi:DNA-binding IclR family transcriptional regulator